MPSGQLTGTRTVLIPAAFSVLTSSCVNQVSQCLANVSSTVSGYAFANELNYHTVE